ncbi:type IV secretion system protein VirB10 [Herbaspirillum seropedicae]|uniref:TrbI/VirB10 family protein n=1 Tax=Herbaspirillum seropedicae TaxID=964 RepID=UPI00339A2A77
MSGKSDLMSPDASPGETSKKAGVRRVNNMPMYIIGGVVLSFMLIMGLVAADRAAKQNAPAATQQEKAGNATIFAKTLAGDKTGGLIQSAGPLSSAAKPDPSQPSTPLMTIAGPESADQPPVPPSPRGHVLSDLPSAGAAASDDEAQRVHIAKMQMFGEAVKARTAVRVEAPRSGGSAPGGVSYQGSSPQTREEMLNRIAAVQQQIAAQRSVDPTAAYQARLAQVRASLNEEGGSFGGAGVVGKTELLKTASSGSDPTGMSQFGQGKQGDRWKLDAQPEPPRSPYELRAGFVVPATLISGVNSELPGQIMAQIAQDVYDTPTGKYLLLPQGSRLLGSYSSDIIYGQARVLIAWQRIVFPDGKALDIGAMPGADSAGYAGFTDQVNNHYLRLFGSAILMSGVTAGIAYSQRQDQGRNQLGPPSAGSALSEALGQQLGQVTAQLIAKNMNIAPTLEIRPGYRFNVVVTKDMAFSKPYRSFDY